FTQPFGQTVAAGSAEPAGRVRAVVSGAGAGVVALAGGDWADYRGAGQLWNIDRGDVDQIERWEDPSPAGTAGRVERLNEYAERADRLSHRSLSDREVAMVAALSFSARSTAVELPY